MGGDGRRRSCSPAVAGADDRCAALIATPAPFRVLLGRSAGLRGTLARIVKNRVRPVAVPRGKGICGLAGWMAADLPAIGVGHRTGMAPKGPDATSRSQGGLGGRFAIAARGPSQGSAGVPRVCPRMESAPARLRIYHHHHHPLRRVLRCCDCAGHYPAIPAFIRGWRINSYYPTTTISVGVTGPS